MFAHVLPQLESLLQEGRVLLKKIKTQSHPSYAKLVDGLAEFEDRLHRFWAPLAHLHAVQNTPELRLIYEAGLVLLTDFYVDLAQDETLFHAYENLAHSSTFQDLDPAQKKVLEHALRDFKLAGVALPPPQKMALKEIEAELAELATHFEQNVMDATEAWSYYTESSQSLAGLPTHLLEQAQARALKQGQSGFILGLDEASYHVVMTHAQNRSLREQFYRAYVTRASDLGDARFDNTPILLKILHLREQKARLLGFETYADYALEGRMAPSVSAIFSFLDDLLQCAHPAALQALSDLQDFALQSGLVSPFEAFDLPYYSELLKVKRFGFSDEALRPFFPISKVLNQLFSILSQVFGLSFRKAERAIWHADVSCFEVYDENQLLRGGIYLDLYGREKKRSGAWMDDCQGRYRKGGEERYPIAYLTTNFLRGQNQEACLTHDDVVTLFHEMGHVLQHVLTQVNEPAVAGISGVPWDAVEFPSQFMEHFAWQPELLSDLPADLAEKLLSSRTFQAGLQMLRQIEFAWLDLALHQKKSCDLQSQTDLSAFLSSLDQRISVLSRPAYYRFLHTFSHIFAGGYAASYYSYKWAEVLSCDAFSRFQEEGVFNRSIGRQFCALILESGGAVDAMDLFLRFRGRPPCVDALLEKEGISVRRIK